MGKQKTRQNHDKVKDTKQVLVTEFKVPMYCNACERSVAKAISKIKGVEKFITDMPRHKVVIIGQIKPEKVVKKIKKKTGKRAEIIIQRKQEDKQGSTKEEKKKEKKKEKEEEEDGLPTTTTNTITTRDYNYLMENYLGFDCILDSQGYTFFSDENPNSCSLM